MVHLADESPELREEAAAMQSRFKMWKEKAAGRDSIDLGAGGRDPRMGFSLIGSSASFGSGNVFDSVILWDQTMVLDMRWKQMWALLAVYIVPKYQFMAQIKKEA